MAVSEKRDESRPHPAARLVDREPIASFFGIALEGQQQRIERARTDGRQAEGSVQVTVDLQMGQGRRPLHELRTDERSREEAAGSTPTPPLR